MDDQLATGDFIGRRRALGQLRALPGTAAAGSGRIFMQTGEPGISKARITEQLVDDARGRGFDVLWRRCKQEPGASLYWPLLQAIDAYARRCPDDRLRAVRGRGAASIAAVAPGVAERCPDVGSAPTASNPDQARIALFSAIADFSKNAAGYAAIAARVGQPARHRCGVAPSARIHRLRTR